MRTSLSALATALVLAATPPAASAQVLAPDTSWVRRAVLYEVFTSHFSPAGSFRGVQAGLDRIQATGATTVWLMPIHPIGVAGRKGTLGSPYAARDFRGINPAFGTADDFRALVKSIHARGMKVILDWVPDHTSPDHPWITQHPDWYFRDSAGVPMVPRDGNGQLTDWTDVRQLDYGNPALRREMIAIMRWWIQEFGIDGYRVDVAGFIPYGFFTEALPQVRAARPEPILLLAEWGDLELHRRGFDLTYSWDAYKRLKAVWKGEVSAAEYVRAEVQEAKEMPAGGMRMRFTTNHDETAWDDTPVKIFGAGARAAFVAAVTMPGRPLLYNGQEVEAAAKVPLFEPVRVNWDQPHAREARAFYAKVLGIVTGEPGFLTGTLAEVMTSAPTDVIAFRRGELVVLVNSRDRAVTATLTGTDLGTSRDLLSGRAVRGSRITLPPFAAMILKRTGR